MIDASYTAWHQFTILWGALNLWTRTHLISSNHTPNSFAPDLVDVVLGGCPPMVIWLHLFRNNYQIRTIARYLARHLLSKTFFDHTPWMGSLSPKKRNIMFVLSDWYLWILSTTFPASKGGSHRIQVGFLLAHSVYTQSLQSWMSWLVCSLILVISFICWSTHRR
jgi:hypothetical protein